MKKVICSQRTRECLTALCPHSKQHDDTPNCNLHCDTIKGKCSCNVEDPMEFRNSFGLVNGWIPAHTECPFKAKCGPDPHCFHKGLEHETEFSCAKARLISMITLTKE